MILGLWKEEGVGRHFNIVRYARERSRVWDVFFHEEIFVYNR